MPDSIGGAKARATPRLWLDSRNDATSHEVNHGVVAALHKSWHHRFAAFPLPRGTSRWSAAAPSKGDGTVRKEPMKYVHIALIVVFTLLIVMFVIQNRATATVALFGSSVTLPLWLLAVGIYVLGMFTGGALAGLVKGWYEGATRKD